MNAETLWAKAKTARESADRIADHAHFADSQQARLDAKQRVADLLANAAELERQARELESRYDNGAF